MKLFFISLLVLFTLFQCKQKEPSVSLLKTIKEMEYRRENQAARWKPFLSLKQSGNIREQALHALGHIRQPSLLPLMDSLLSRPYSVAEKRNLIFAMGQTGTAEAEKLLLKHYPVFNDSLKKETLLALSQCGSSKSLNTLQSALSQPALYREALITSAILARKKVDVGLIHRTLQDSLWPHAGEPAEAYFYSYAVEREDIPVLQKTITNSSGETRKYYLKALDRLLRRESRITDSIKTELGASIHAALALRYKPSWRELYQGLRVLGLLADSSSLPLVKQTINHPNHFVRMEALRTFQKINGSKSLSFLLDKLRKTKSLEEKAAILPLITKIKPSLGYQLINQYLDKGNSTFKAQLLETLSKIKNRMALQIVRTFLKTQDPLLVQKSFSLLDGLNKLRFREVEALMNTSFYGVMYTVLDWQVKRKKSVDASLLVDAFSRFSRPDQFETQELIISLLEKKKNALSAEQYARLETAIHSARVAGLYKQKLRPDFKWDNKMAPPPPAYISADSALSVTGKSITAHIKTSRGDIDVELFTSQTPLTVINFFKLASSGFYNNLSFHRVVPDFVIQGGDPNGDGSGGPGYTIPSEDRLPFERGTMGIATAGFDTGGSQFFICHSAQPHLRGNYTAFGKVVSGMQVVDAISAGDIILSIHFSIK